MVGLTHTSATSGFRTPQCCQQHSHTVLLVLGVVVTVATVSVAVVCQLRILCCIVVRVVCHAVRGRNFGLATTAEQA